MDGAPSSALEIILGETEATLHLNCRVIRGFHLAAQKQLRQAVLKLLRV